MDKVLFGDNQFYGVNHLSNEKGKQTAIKFGTSEAVLDFLGYVVVEGINTFVCSTRPQIIPLMELIRNDKRFKNFKVFPTIPDVHKFNNALSEYGVIGTIKNVLPNNLFGFAAKGGFALLTKDILSLLEIVIDLEMKIFDKIQTDVVFIQNNVTDLLLGLEMKDVFIKFSNYIRKKYNAEPGFMTMNLPKLVDFLEYADVEDPIICSSINKIGFRMFGGKELYEHYLINKNYQYIAMQPLASGALPPQEAIEYLSKFKNIKAILFGSANKNHVASTKEIILKYFQNN